MVAHVVLAVGQMRRKDVGIERIPIVDRRVARQEWEWRPDGLEDRHHLDAHRGQHALDYSLEGAFLAGRIRVIDEFVMTGDQGLAVGSG